MKKRLLSLLTALCLMLTLAPAAFAADTAVTTEEQLNAAISSASQNDTITLGADITLSKPVTVDKAAIIDGAGYTLTSDNFIAIKITASGVTIKNVNIETDSHGIHFDANGLTNPTLDIIDTNISKITVDELTGVCYGADNRGINAYNVKGGTVNIKDCEILGFKYALNPVVDPVSSTNSLRNGNGTTFNITGTTIQGWTALNVWSAKTTYNFTNCHLWGVNKFSGGSNDYSTIMANDNIYGSDKNYASTINIIGGDVNAVRYSESQQTAVYVDSQLITQIFFQENDDGDTVKINCYGTEGYPASVFMFQGFLSDTSCQSYVSKTGYYDYAEATNYIITLPETAVLCDDVQDNDIALLQQDITITNDMHIGGDVK